MCSKLNHYVIVISNTVFTWTLKSGLVQPELSNGWYKTLTVDYGLDCELDYGLSIKDPVSPIYIP